MVIWDFVPREKEPSMPTAAELMLEMPEHLSPKKVGNLKMTVQFNLSGDGGGNWCVRVADGKCTVEEGVLDEPQATIQMAAGDFVRMTAGELHPMTAFLAGKINAQGDVNSLIRFQNSLEV
jgi:putative sterol carrier protein